MANTGADLLTPKEAAAYLRVSNIFLWRKRKAGLVQGVKFGKKVLIERKELDRFIESSREAATNGK